MSDYTAPPTIAALRDLWMSAVNYAGASERFDRAANFDAWAEAHTDVAPCGDTFDTPADVRSHEVACGACAGALELAATVTLVTCVVGPQPGQPTPTASFAVFTTPERAREWIMEDIRETFGHHDGFDGFDDDARREYAAWWGVSYATETADLDPADPGN